MRILLVLMMILAPMTAHALSCMRPNPAMDLHNLLSDGKTPVVMIGDLTVIEKAPPRTDREPVTARYRLHGRRLGGDVAETMEVLVTARCHASWCANPPEDVLNQLMVFEQTPETGALHMDLGPCYGRLHDVPDADGLAVLQRCLDTATCANAAIDHFHPSMRKKK